MNEKTQLVDRLGGPTQFARLLGILDRPGSVQRVGNWKRRGVPAKVLLEHAEDISAALQRAACDSSGSHQSKSNFHHVVLTPKASGLNEPES